MKRLDVENSEEYKEAERTIMYLNLVKEYYTTDKSLDELETPEIQLREIFRFMSDHGFPKRGFVDQSAVDELVSNITQEINNIETDLKKARISEIQDRNLNSLLIIPSWSEVLGRETKGFYLNRPVTMLKRDTIIMLSHEILNVTDKLGVELALVTGPGILFTEFSLDNKSYIINTREVNCLMLPTDKLEKLLDAEPIFKSDINATLNELISIIPFTLIEEAYSVQALLRGVISRNIFHPNKAALDTFLDICSDPTSFDPNEGYKILSAHEEYFNRLLLTQPPKAVRGDESINVASAGIAAILTNGQQILDEMLDSQEQIDMLLKFKDIKDEFNKIGRELLENWLP